MAAKSFHFESARTARALAACAVLCLMVSYFVVPVVGRAGGWWTVTAGVMVLVTMVVCAAAIGHRDDLGVLFELNVRRKFRAICEARKLTGVDDQGRTVYPGYRHLIGNENAWHMLIEPLPGQSVADWERAASAFELYFKVPGVRFGDNLSGLIMMKAGHNWLDAQEFRPRPEGSLPAADGQTWRQRLAYVLVGARESGGGYLLPLLDSHILIAGITGAGKGSVIWSTVLGLSDAWKAGVVRFWGIDPKRMELSIGRNFFDDRYAVKEEAMVELLERAASEMLEAAESMGGKVRKFTPSELTPVNVVVIDELGYLSSMLSDRKLQQRADKALQSILVLGRSVGFVVIGALQDPRKETLAYRDLFPTRVAMKLDKPMVDLVLGTGMWEAGAKCNEIPPPTAGGAGMAFVKAEGSGIPECVRFMWCSDEVITQTAGELPPPAAVPMIA